MAWLHYIGGKYTQKSFIAEAKRYGFSRRIPSHMLKLIKWGDPIYFATWRGTKDLTLIGDNGKEEENHFKRGKAEIFAKGKIDRITIEDPEVNRKVQERLRKEGKIIRTYGGSGRMVKRACGYYYEGGGAETTAELDEIYEIAVEVAGGKPFKVMIMGDLIEVFDPPKEINAPFTRSLLHYDDPAGQILDVEYEVHGAIVELKDYRRARKKDDFALPLPLEVG